MKEALHSLDEANWTVEIRELFRILNVTEEEVSIAVKAITDAHLAFITDPEVHYADDALRTAGWYNQRPEVRYLIYGRLGEVMLGGFFLAIREVRMLGDEPPHATEIADFIVEGLRVAQQLGRTGPPDANMNDGAAVELQFSRRARSEQNQLLKLQRQALGTAQKEVQAQQERAATAAEALRRVNSLNLWSGLCRAISVWWHGNTSQTPDDAKTN
jgi:hypothetical protein